MILHGIEYQRPTSLNMVYKQFIWQNDILDTFHKN